MFTGICFAVPASPFPNIVKQPDGVEIEIYRKGDERANWSETKDGYSIVKNENTGYWEYALLEIKREISGGKETFRLVLVPSGIVCRPDLKLPEGWPKGLHPSPIKMEGKR